jgi:hypothetical protein
MSRSAPSRPAAEVKPEMPAETDHEVMFLLRHFSQSPGLWYVGTTSMDAK